LWLHGLRVRYFLKRSPNLGAAEEHTRLREQGPQGCRSSAVVDLDPDSSGTLLSTGIPCFGENQARTDTTQWYARGRMPHCNNDRFPQNTLIGFSTLYQAEILKPLPSRGMRQISGATVSEKQMNHLWRRVGWY
jgi:hypothetical protein